MLAFGRIGALSALLGLAGCEPAFEIDTSRAECENLDPENCLLPWPSSRYLVADPSTETGWRVAIPPEAMPQNRRGTAVDPGPWNAWDGFSPMSSILAELPVRIDATALAGAGAIARSLEADSPTVLLDATTGERVAHFAEIETDAQSAPERTTLYLRPAARLSPNHHYVVALRALSGIDGAPVLPSEYFRVLRDGVATANEEVERRRDGFTTDVFAPLAQAGVARDDLILAWDFRTASGGSAWRDLVAMRDGAVAFAASGAFACTVTQSIEDPSDPHVFRRIEGHFTVPLYVDSLAEGGRLVRDAAGLPMQNGTVEAEFTAIIPRSVATSIADGGAPVRLVNYGHGLYSSRTEILADFMVETADAYPMVVASTDVFGLGMGDQAATLGALGELNRFGSIIDRVRQSMLHLLLLPSAIASRCSADPAFEIGGLPVVDPSQRYYYGNSQGGNLGPTIAALSQDMDRFVLGVGGISYPVMLPRNFQWPLLEGAMSTAYTRRIDRDLLMVMSAHHWELTEGSAFAPHVLRDPLPGSLERHVLAQVGRNDAQVANVASEMAARTLGLPQPTASVAPVFGAATVSLPAPDAFVVYDTGVEDVPVGPNEPAQENGVHEAVRRDPRAQQQLDAFLRPGGEVIDACGGACAPLP